MELTAKGGVKLETPVRSIRDAADFQLALVCTLDYTYVYKHKG